MFTPCPKTRMEIIEEVFSPWEQSMTFEKWVCKLHKRTLLGQDLSVKGLVKVLRAGYTVDLLLQDGTEILNSNVSDARVKLVYNTTVTPPDNGIVAWCPHSPLEGKVLCAQSLV